MEKLAHRPLLHCELHDRYAKRSNRLPLTGVTHRICVVVDLVRFTRLFLTLLGLRARHGGWQGSIKRAVCAGEGRCDSDVRVHTGEGTAREHDEAAE